MPAIEVSQPDNEKLLKEYLAQLSVTPNNTRQLFVVGMVGIVGSGKSSFARELAEAAHLYVASNDVIRRFLNAKGFTGDSPIQATLQYIAESTGKYLYENQVSYVIDADLLKFHELARQNAMEAGARFYLVKVECPETVIRKRVIQRSERDASASDENHSRADIAEYERRKAIYDETPEPAYDLVIHSDKPLEPQVEELCKMLSAAGVLD